MSNLSHHLYRPMAGGNILFQGKIAPATISPVHLVYMHGLFGNSRNFASLCTSMAGLDTEARLKAEAQLPLTTSRYITNPPPPLSPALEARAYNCAAFDWRNHGDSAHNVDMSLDGLTEDLVRFIEIYAAKFRFETLQTSKISKNVECVPVKDAPPIIKPTREQLPVVLVAHSMGAMAMMHWMWREHVNIWASRIFLGEDSPLITQNVFNNSRYKVVGAVIVDMAPSQRPDSFNDTIRMIEFLPQMPLTEVRTPLEAEKWLLANGPQDVFNQHNLYQMRYHLSNIDFADPSGVPKWRIGLQEIIGGLHEILWEEGGIACLQQVRDALMVANRRRIQQRKRIWERPTKFHEFPTYFIFGQDSPYNTEAARTAITDHFLDPYLVEMSSADHFMFMRHKTTFMPLLRDFLYEVEVRNSLSCVNADVW